MTFVVSDACVKCKHTDCVEVCPVDCFYEGPNFLDINPDECIDCALCEPECPVDAIFSEDELPESERFEGVYHPSMMSMEDVLVSKLTAFYLGQESKNVVLGSEVAMIYRFHSDNLSNRNDWRSRTRNQVYVMGLYYPSSL